MLNIPYLAKNHIGPRTVLKSFSTYRKSKAGTNAKGLRSFLLSGNTQVSLGKNATIEHRGVFRFGLSEGLRPSTVAGMLQMSDNSKLILDGAVLVGPGVRLIIHEQAVLELDDVFINSNSTITCAENIKIGKRTMIGCDVDISDSDFHKITREDFEVIKPVLIGSHVWIGARAMILKGVTVGSGSIIACGAIVTRDIPENSLAAGIPARVIRKNVNWEV